MSFIDLFKNEEIGTLHNIAVYLIHEDVNEEIRENPDFIAKKGQFILGGGGGEHPAAVIEDAKYMVYFYLMTELELFGKEEEYEFIDDYLINNRTGLKYYDWNIEDYSNIVKMKELFSRRNLERAEDWLAYELGKIIADSNYNPEKELTDKILKELDFETEKIEILSEELYFRRSSKESLERFLGKDIGIESDGGYLIKNGLYKVKTDLNMLINLTKEHEIKIEIKHGKILMY